MIGFLSFNSKINWTALPCLFFVISIQVLLRGVSSAIRELFTHIRQHVYARLVFSAGCAEAKGWTI